MATVRGVIEILQMADVHGPKTFNDFTRISINNKRLSSAPVSKRLRELIAVDTIEEVITRSKSGRRTVGYKTTQKGKKSDRTRYGA
jgi:hypothetical protein